MFISFSTFPWNTFSFETFRYTKGWTESVFVLIHYCNSSIQVGSLQEAQRAARKIRSQHPGFIKFLKYNQPLNHWSNKYLSQFLISLITPASTLLWFWDQNFVHLPRLPVCSHYHSITSRVQYPGMGRQADDRTQDFIRLNTYCGILHKELSATKMWALSSGIYAD